MVFKLQALQKLPTDPRSEVTFHSVTRKLTQAVGVGQRGDTDYCLLRLESYNTAEVRK